VQQNTKTIVKTLNPKEIPKTTPKKTVRHFQGGLRKIALSGSSGVTPKKYSNHDIT